MKYKEGDIVLVRSAAGKAIPKFHVKLLRKIVIKPSKGRDPNWPWPGYTTWEATPIYQKEVDMLRKKWQISFRKANEDLTFINEEDIIKKIKTN
tara:strand:- start:147 stop:428 length:282 start_codon:yes stop_codon:yes gene_type:complete